MDELERLLLLDPIHMRIVEVVKKSSYAFLANVSRLVDFDTVELIPGYTLRKASDEEHFVSQEALKRLLTNTFLWTSRFPEPTLPDGTIGPASYSLISFAGHGDRIPAIQSAFDLVTPELEIGFKLYSAQIDNPEESQGFGMQHSPWHLFRASLTGFQPDQQFFCDVSLNDVKRIQHVLTKLANHDHSILELTRFLQQLRELKGLPDHSPLQFLGYFAILEALLTHIPQPTDIYQSITRQVTTKVALLNSRWTCKLDYQPFGEAKAERIWKGMYSYRSTLAHGGSPDFKRELNLLKDRQTALHLIKETVKSVMRYALEEPSLLRDLREC